MKKSANKAPKTPKTKVKPEVHADAHAPQAAPAAKPNITLRAHARVAASRKAAIGKAVFQAPE